MNNLIEQLQALKGKIVFDEYRKKNIRNILLSSRKPHPCLKRSMTKFWRSIRQKSSGSKTAPTTR